MLNINEYNFPCSWFIIWTKEFYKWWEYKKIVYSVNRNRQKNHTHYVSNFTYMRCRLLVWQAESVSLALNHTYLYELVCNLGHDSVANHVRKKTTKYDLYVASDYHLFIWTLRKELLKLYEHCFPCVTD